MKKQLAVLFAAVAVISGMFLSTQAFASTMSTSDPYYIGSWAQRFREDGVYNGGDNLFDKFEVFNVSGNSWEAPAMVNFSMTNWVADMVNPDYVLAEGPAVAGILTWYFHFLGSNSEPSIFDFLAYNGDVLLGATQVNWSGTGWSYANINTDGTGYNRSPVPEPATMVLFGCGLLSAAVFGRKKLSKGRS